MDDRTQDPRRRSVRLRRPRAFAAAGWLPAAFLVSLLAALPARAEGPAPSSTSASDSAAATAAQPLAAAPADSGQDAPPPAPVKLAEVTPGPPDYPRGAISGLVFGDLYGNLVGDPRHFYDAKGADQGQVNIDGKKNITKDLNGVQIRRVYLQLDNDLTARLATRVRLESDSKELTSGGKITFFLKNAYFQAKSVVPRGDFYFGEINTPTFEDAEAFWQYRAVEKTVGDFWGLRPASDLGIELKGFADSDHHLGYSAMVGDGNGQKPETDKFKTFYLAVPIRVGELRLEPYVDYQSERVNAGRLAVSDTVTNADQATYRLFAGYDFGRWAVGAEAYDRIAHRGPLPDANPRAGSLFARGKLGDALSVFGRVDQFTPDHRAPNRVDVRLWIAGLDWQPLHDLHVLPNFEQTQYLGVGSAVGPPHHDLQARLTFFYLFSRPQS